MKTEPKSDDREPPNLEVGRRVRGASPQIQSYACAWRIAGVRRLGTEEADRDPV